MSEHGYVLPPTRAGRFVISDVAVVDVAGGAAIPGQDVTIDHGVIASVRPHGEPVATHHVKVDGHGRWLAPAYVDGHAHVLNSPSGVEASHALMLASGIWGWRQLSGDNQLLDARRAGRLPSYPGSPALLAMPGQVLTPLNAGDEAQTRETVRSQAARGADFIKVAMTNRETCLAAIDEAATLGLPVVGHLPDDLDPREASAAGLRCVEHLGPGNGVFSAVSRRGDEARRHGRPRSLPPFAGRFEPLVQKVITRVVVNPQMATSADDAVAMRIADDGYDPALAAELAQVYREHETWQCPTLIRLHTMEFADAHEHTRDAGVRYVDPAEVRRWRLMTRRFRRLPDATRRAFDRRWHVQVDFLRALADADVAMFAGTDANGAGWVIPGLALHDEFALLAHAGLSALQILRMATAAPARFLGIEDAHGQVREGFAADLVLLGGDPTRDVAALSDLHGVVRGGGWWDKDDLDAILERVAAEPTAR
ncbi:amidohydrolase family protein [Nigerium massiliense]|uniref:amidohydrolase family protein n=1 Tax=Nigerium massiliense TaxID=1522317 RepID=UPI000590239E|nr:amidohydrolase family protein [Nigerium massiliense]